jgi:hypothetical protein
MSASQRRNSSCKNWEQTRLFLVQWIVRTENYYWLIHLAIAVLATLASAEDNFAQKHIPGGRPPTNLNARASVTESVKSKSFLSTPAAAPTTSQMFVLTNKNSGALLFSPPGAFLHGRGPSTNQPSPGVYEAAPYKGIVIVPDAQPDDRCIIVPPAAQPHITTIAPDLKLVPRKSK